jgi:hypothetical protein
MLKLPAACKLQCKGNGILVPSLRSRHTVWSSRRWKSRKFSGATSRSCTGIHWVRHSGMHGTLLITGESSCCSRSLQRWCQGHTQPAGAARWLAVHAPGACAAAPLSVIESLAQPGGRHSSHGAVRSSLLRRIAPLHRHCRHSQADQVTGGLEAGVGVGAQQRAPGGWQCAGEVVVVELTAAVGGRHHQHHFGASYDGQLMCRQCSV